MICCNSAFEQGNLDLWRYINAFIILFIIITIAIIIIVVSNDGITTLFNITFSDICIYLKLFWVIP